MALEVLALELAEVRSLLLINHTALANPIILKRRIQKPISLIDLLRGMMGVLHVERCEP